MNTAQWIQIVFSGALVLVTGALALITYGYVIATKKMADSMDQQSKILQKEYEFRAMLFTEENLFQRETLVLNPKADLTITNKGFYAVYCLNVDIKIFHNDKPKECYEDSFDILKLLGKGEEHKQEITFEFSQLSSFSANKVPRNDATVIIIFHYLSIDKTEIKKEKRYYY